LTQKKFLRLNITLTADGRAGLMAENNQSPLVFPLYEGFNPPKSTVTLTMEAYTASQGSLQFEWTIFPQPMSEEVDLSSFNVSKNGKDVPFDTSWIQNISMESHCPEPATWMMLFVGLGLVGGAARRGRAAPGQTPAGGYPA
jgi:hypothetical protein